MSFIVKTVISDDLSVGCIGCTNFGPPTKQSVRLVEIGSLRDVGGDEHIILVGLGDTVHLDGKQHRDSIFFELSRQSNGFGASPAMPVNDDASLLFFFRR